VRYIAKANYENPEAAMQEIKDADTWNSAIGRAWARMMRVQRLDPTGTVVEIGPGFTDKVARGLADLHFRGTVVLVEPNEAAGDWAFERYGRLLPAAEVLIVRHSISATKIPTERAVEALVSNHILDDLILHAALQPVISERIFGRMKPGVPCSQRFIHLWRDLLAQSERLEKLITQVAQEFVDYVQKLQPRLVLLNQYPSWRHNQHDLNSINAQVLRLMQLLETNLGAVCINDNNLLGVGHQHSVRWLVGVLRDGSAFRTDTVLSRSFHRNSHTREITQ
jgi:hypothetical protein